VNAAYFDDAALARFERQYDSSHEDSALRARGQFIQKFPVDSLHNLTVDEYVIGRRKPSFCYFVEPGTKDWANIMGATSFKFGIYFGRTKSDPAHKYRFANRFGTNEKEAFESVKAAVLDLVRLGVEEQPDFAAIDANPLSQMFKAKILSLYFPERFLPVCSAEHLDMLGSSLGFPEDLPHSQYQNLLHTAKKRHPRTRGWSEPRFMAFVYKVYIRGEGLIDSPIAKPRARKHKRVDSEEMQKQRSELGRAAEDFALEWEKDRLRGARLERLIARIEDRRDRPGYGYDFLSFSSEELQRFIEVKCVAKLKDGHRFFLSDNEHHTSSSTEHSGRYYFYLVFFDAGKPAEVLALLAGQLYPKAEMLPASYEVRFDRQDFSKDTES